MKVWNEFRYNQRSKSPFITLDNEAWKQDFSVFTLTQFEAEGQWEMIKEAIKLARKLSIFRLVCHNSPQTQVSLLLPSMRKILIKGSPPHLRMLLTSTLANC